jgi:hypothetical protein
MYRGAYLRASKATTGDPGPHEMKKAARQSKPAPSPKIIQMAGWRVKEGGKIRPMTRGRNRRAAITRQNREG